MEELMVEMKASSTVVLTVVQLVASMVEKSEN
jgi:hypothetical protein